ncbi:CMRF35-like molecule 5 isoform X1 [Struthio camelus]|uniref:CMRF35-like molecule 5 isoform X1 n=1 Tax=Struthio camelus TaxID=8801 RepID=UPI003604179F
MRIFLIWTLFPGGWAVTGPAQVRSEPGGSVSVSCSYEPGYERYSKYWCQPFIFSLCFTSIVRTAGSEAQVMEGQVSIRDNHTSHAFTVTLQSVERADAGWYFCGMAGILRLDLRHAVQLIVSAAVSAFRTPPETEPAPAASAPPGSAISTTTEASSLAVVTQHGGMSPPAATPPCPTDHTDPPALSWLGVTHLLLFLGAKVPVVLALVCWSWCGSRGRRGDASGRRALPPPGSL